MPPQQALFDARRPVKVSLKDLRARESIPNRTVLLQPPTYETTIGRGSQAEPNLHPQEWNAWFGSRVMSREHAYLRADLETRQIFLEDAASMHGTYVRNLRMEPGRAQAILEDDTIQLGTEIVRGDQTYKPLVLSIRAEFFDEYSSSNPHADPDEELTLFRSNQSQLRNPVDSSHMPKNTFTIDYSEEEDDDDVEVVYEAVRVPSSEIDRQSRTFSVPDSDLSDSDVEPSTDKESAPSSPEERPAKAPTSNPSCHPGATMCEATCHNTKPTPVLPGSSLQNALDVSDDEGSEENKNKEKVSQEADATSIYSEEYHDSTDEDIDLNLSDPEYESDADMYEDDDAQEEQSIDDANYRESNASHGQAHNETIPRSPSPSDCALPKPSWYPPSNLPAIQSLVEQVPQQPMIFPDAFSVGSAQLSPFQSFGCYPGMSWTSGENNTGFAGTFDQGFNAHPLVPFQQNIPQAPRLCSRSLPGRCPQTTQPIESPSTAATEDGTAKPSKVSINDIIDDVTSSPVSTGTNRKRKADEMSTTKSTEDDAETCEVQSRYPEPSASDTNTEAALVPPTESEIPQPSAEISTQDDIVLERATPSKKSVTFSAIPVVIDTDSDRPHKKAKTQSENRNNNFLKYFAAAVGGATLGAVGTVFGLAALPSDYFL